jgi:hypothetical protein
VKRKASSSANLNGENKHEDKSAGAFRERIWSAS